MSSVFKAVLRITMIISSFFGKVRGGAHSTPALQELTVPGWEMAEWKIVLPALQELSAPVGPPSQFCARCTYTPHAGSLTHAGTKENISTWRFRTLLILSNIFLHQKCLQVPFAFHVTE